MHGHILETKNLNQMKIKNLKLSIQNNLIIKNDELFQGAGLIISLNELENKEEKYVYVISKDAYSYSWFVFELKKIFFNEIDFLNKYEFYPLIGITINLAISKKLSLKDSLLYTLDNIEEIINSLS